MFTLKQWRLAKEKTQQEMADLCGVHRNTYAAWEDNPEIITIKYAKIIANILDVSINDIIFLPNNSTNCR